MPEILDTNRNTFGHYDALKAAGVKTVIRYLMAGGEKNEKVIKQGEAHAIADAGLRLGLVYEIDGTPSGSGVGTRDGIAAKGQASAAGAPSDGSVILWYTVDWDAPESAMPGIIAAVKAFKAQVEPQFRVGIYASGGVCDELWNLKLIVGRWLTDSRGFRGTRDSMAAGRYELLQALPTTIAGLDTDPDALHAPVDGKATNIGDFVPFAQSTPTSPAPVDPPPPQAPPADDVAAIVAIANASPIARYAWRGRGVAPLAYTQGMALAFAQTYRRLKASHPAAVEMAKPRPVDNDDAHDALSWYHSNFVALGMSNDNPTDTLRHLFVLMLGHAMRESSGQYCCGRDSSVSDAHQTSDSAEAGLFQTSYDAHGCSPLFDLLMDEFASGKVEGYRAVFAAGVSCSARDRQNFGSGRGAAFQALCKDQPAFAVESAAIVLRNLRTHYGPIDRKEVELRPEADEMFKAIQAHVDQEAATPQS